MRLLLAIGLIAFGITACTKAKEVVAAASTSNHKVTFDIEVISHDGKRPLKIECVDFEEFDAYKRDQNASFMSGKKPSVEKPKMFEFATAGQPERNMKAMIELPATKVFCAIDGQPITVRMGEETSQVFVPKSDTTLKVAYNMYTKKYNKADSAGANVELIKQ